MCRVGNDLGRFNATQHQGSGWIRPGRLLMWIRFPVISFEVEKWSCRRYKGLCFAFD